MKSGNIGSRIAKDTNFLKVGIEGLAESMGSPMLTPEQLQVVSAKLYEGRSTI